MRYMCFDMISRENVYIMDPMLWTKEVVLEQTAYFSVYGKEYQFRIQEALEAGLLKPEDLNPPKITFDE